MAEHNSTDYHTKLNTSIPITAAPFASTVSLGYLTAVTRSASVPKGYLTSELLTIIICHGRSDVASSC